MEASGSQSRGRLLIALAAAAALGALVIVVVALGGDDEAGQSATAASPACIHAWNRDPAATTFGRHNFNFHRYEGALVTFLSPQAVEVSEDDGGLCAVIFPSRVLDTEPIAAGEVLRGGNWLPISALHGVELAQVAALQADAANTPNTTLDTTGELTVR